jgi:hypothetical protein
MIRKAFAAARTLTVVIFFIATFTLLATLAALAQQTDTGQSLAGLSILSSPGLAGTLAQEPFRLPRPGADQTYAVLARRMQEKQSTFAAADSGNPLFLPVVAYDGGGVDTRSVAIADMNGDGRPDLIVVNPCIRINDCTSGSVGVLLGNGDGTFRASATYASGYSSMSVAVADVDGDSNLDVVVANSCVAANNCAMGSISVLLGNGDGTLRTPVSYDTGPGQPLSIAVGDVNRDGKPDLGVAIWSNGKGSGESAVGVLLGNGDGTFQPVVAYDSGADSDSVAFADLNGDGKPDLLVGDATTVAVLLGNGDGTFQPKVEYSAWIPGDTPVGIGTVAAADVNGDGKLDLVAANQGSGNNNDGSVAVLLGNGDGTFQPAVNYDSGGDGAFSVAVADVDLDGKPDLVATNYGWTPPKPRKPGSVGVLLGNGDGTFRPAVTYYSGGGFAISLAVTDLNSDGSPDVVVANQYGSANGDGTVGVMLNNISSPRASTTTSLTSGLNVSVYGESVTFTARVSSSSGTPTGIVELFDGLMGIGGGTVANGKTSIAVSLLPAGSDSITAVYEGSATFASSTSSPLIETVTAATTSTGLSSSLNPASTGQSVTFSATVTSQFGGLATGPVVFYSGSQTLGTASLSGNRATLTTSFASSGPYPISAKYNGDGNNQGSTSSSLSQVIIASTTTKLTSSLNPSLAGQAVTFTAAVSSTAGAPPNGESVTFHNGSGVLGTASLSGGIASLNASSLPVGIFTITATYAGDAKFAASTSPGLRQVVNSTTKSATSTALVSSLNPSIYGQKISWTATVKTSGSVEPTGKVNFTWNGHSIGTATLNASGVATLSKSSLNVYTYPISAVYAGDANNVGSASTVLNQVVKQTTSTAKLTSSANPSTLGQVVTFTASISSPTVTATGPVTFTSGTTVLGTSQLSGGKATLTTSTLAVGATTVKATYYGDSNIAGSSAAVTQMVQQ